MANNDQIILDQVLEQERSKRAPELSKADFFELYIAEQILKDFDLSDEEIEAGVVGQGGDGGIDGIYVFANGELVREDFDASSLKKNITIDVFIIQAKTSAGYDEGAVTKFELVTRDLFDLSRSTDAFKGVYNSDVRAAVDCFRTLYTELAARFPALRFHYVFATRGESSEVHPNVSRKVADVKNAVVALFSAAEFEFAFLGASDLLKIARRQPITSFQLSVGEIISAQGGYIALVRLTDFDKFLRDEQGALRKHLFEANVRDYQGTIQVNEEIQKSLSVAGAEDFWWLNNGVTIIAGKAVQSGKILTIEDPQIVNGLQTSTEVYKYFSSSNTNSEKRNLMVRVIVPNSPESNDKIIKATNSQTSIPPASLRATDKIHRDIEQFLRPHGLFYDRRKNMYRNEGKPMEQIIGIPMLAQSVMSTLLQRPDDARARPSSLLKSDDDYAKIFNPSYPIQMYLIAAQIIKAIQSYLRAQDTLSAKDKNNLLFYTAMHLASRLSNCVKPAPGPLAAIQTASITPVAIEASFSIVKAAYDELGGSDQVAKGAQLLERIKTELAS